MSKTAATIERGAGTSSIYRAYLALCDEIEAIGEESAANEADLDRRIEGALREQERNERDERLAIADLLEAQRSGEGDDLDEALRELRERRSQVTADATQRRSEIREEYASALEELSEVGDERLREAWRTFAANLAEALQGIASDGDDVALRAMREDLAWVGSALG